MIVLGEKLGGGPTDQLAGALGIMSEALFLKSSRVRPMLLMASERLPGTWTGHRKCTWTGVRSVRVVYIRFSPAGCISIRIVVTLRYE
jgi:hypothetical protein